MHILNSMFLFKNNQQTLLYVGYMYIIKYFYDNQVSNDF